MILLIIKKAAKILTGFAILLLIIVVLWKVPEWQVANLKGLNAQDLFTNENEARTTLAQILGGFALLFGIYLTWRRITATERNLEIAQDGQITERFTRAIEQLGSEKLEVRLGGIYALERIAQDSEKDHWPIMEVLTSYVRENSPWADLENDHGYIMEMLIASPQEPLPVEEKSVLLESHKNQIEEYVTTQSDVGVADRDTGIAHKPKPDIQAILTVIGRRSRTFGKGESQRLDLSHTDLRGISLGEANLEWAKLNNSDLSWAKLGGAQLQHARLWGARIERASLVRANLEGADLTGARMKMTNLSMAYLKGASLMGARLELVFLNYADVRHANLWRAHLEGLVFNSAEMEGTDLQETHLERADLTGAKGLTEEQIRQAFINEETILPDYLKHLEKSAEPKAKKE